MIRAGVGQSQSRSSTDAGRQIAEAAIGGLDGAKPRLLLVHATEGYDQALLLQTIREVAGAVPIAGCSAEGVIGHDGSDEGFHAATLLALGGTCEAQTHLEVGLAADPAGCGERLAAWVSKSRVSDPRLLLIYPDGLSGNCGGMLDALVESLPAGITVVGGTAADAMRMEQTHQYSETGVESDAVSAALIGGAFVPKVVVSHGCSAVGSPLLVTSGEGAMVTGLDGQPPWEVFRHYLEGEPESAPVQQVVHLCLLLEGGPEGPDGVSGGVARSPVAIDDENGAMRFPGGLEAGTRVRMGIRDPDRVAIRAVEAAQGLFLKPPAEAASSPICVLHFDCAGRGRSLFGPAVTEKAIAPLLATRPAGVPWSGFHTFGEIGPVGGRPRFHNYTLVLCALFPELES